VHEPLDHEPKFWFPGPCISHLPTRVKLGLAAACVNAFNPD